MLQWCRGLFFVMVLPGIQDSGQPSSDFRLAVPEQQDQERANALVREIYKDELAASQTAERQGAIAPTLLKRSREAGTDPATRFALITLAKDLALRARDDFTAIRAVDELGSAFRVDEDTLRLDLLGQLAASAKTPMEFQRCFDAALLGMERALHSERWAGAQALLDFAEQTAKRSENPEASALAGQHRSRIRELETGHDIAVRAISVLQNDSADPTANMIVGRYQCFLHDNWEHGLSHLLRGGDANVASLARLELKLPKETLAQVEVADGWWNLAEHETPAARNGLRAHAATWYRRALAQLDAKTRARVAARLVEIDPPPPAPKNALRLNPGDWVLRRINGERWASEALRGTFNEFSGGTLRLRNSVREHDRIKIAYAPTILEGNFTAWLKYRGEPKSIELCPEDGADSALYIENMPKDRESHVVTMSRTGDEVRAWVDGTPVPILDYNAGHSVAGFFSVKLNAGCSVELQYFAFRGGRPK